MGTKTKLFIGLLLITSWIGLLNSCKDSSTSNKPNESPTVTFSITPTEGIMPHEVTVSVTGTDSDGSIASYHFDADGDGTAEITQSSPIDQNYTYEDEGTYQAQAWVSDDEGSDSSQESIQVSVQTNKPIFTTQGQNWNVVEGDMKAYALSDLVENGTITNAEIDSPASLEIKDGTLYINGGDFSEADIDRALRLYAENENGTNEENVNINLEGRTDANIKLGLLGRNTNISGQVDIYNANGDVIKTVEVPENGKKVQLDNSQEYKITITNTNTNAYKGRTKIFKPNQTGQDITATIKALAHPKTNTNLNPAEKQAYIEETDFRAGYANNTIGVIIDFETTPTGKKVKWEKDTIEGIAIFKTNREKTDEGQSKGTYTNNQIQTIENKINNTNDDIGACLQTIDTDYKVVVLEEGQEHESYTFDGAFTIANDGWIIVQPDEEMGFFGGTSYEINDNYEITAKKIRINPEKINNLTDGFEYVVAHEFLHAFSGFAEHTTTVPRNKTIMQGGLSADETRKKPEAIDLKMCIEYNDANLSAGREIEQLYNFQ